MYNELILNQLKKIDEEQIAISRSTYFTIKALLIQEGVTDEKEQIHIMKSFNDNYYFSQFKTIKADDFSPFIIPDHRYSGFSDNKYSTYFSNLFGKTDTLTNRHHHAIIQATINYYTGNNEQIAYVFTKETYTKTNLKLLTKKDFDNIVIIPDDDQEAVFLFTLNKEFLEDENQSFSEQTIKRITNQFKGSEGIKHILNSLTYSCLDSEVIKEWFYSSFSKKEIQNIENTENDEIISYFNFLNFEKIDDKELKEIYKTDTERYDDYIIRLEKLKSYYNDEFETLIKTLNQLTPLRDIYSVDVKENIVLNPSYKFPINNAVFVDMSNIIQKR